MIERLKSLARETLVYGFSTVLGRLLNVLLLPLYTHTLRPGDYGVVATLFAYIAFLNILYTRGMELAYMRQASAESGESRLFSTAFWSLAAGALGFSALLHVLADPLAAAAGLGSGGTTLVRYAAWIMATDAIAVIPLAELRLTHQAWTFVGVRAANIALNVALSIIFLAGLGLGVEGVLMATLAASSASLAMLAPVVARRLGAEFDRDSHGALLRFGLPLVPAGLATTAIQVLDRPILKALTDDASVGLYQANCKLAAFMLLGVNMFDAAFRPFYLQRAADPDHREVMARVMTYFVAGATAFLLAVWLFLPDIVALPMPGGRTLIHRDYWPGLRIVPWIMLGYLLHGVYFNLLAPLSLARRTDLVAYATAAGAAINVAGNFALVPRWGIDGAAAATVLAYAAMAATLLTHARRVYPIPYEYSRLAKVGACGAGLAAAASIWPAAMSASGGAGLLARLALLGLFPAALAACGFLAPEERRVLLGARRGERGGV